MDEEHKSLNHAIVAVMAEVKRLEKDQENAFANYMFTSIDDYKDELRPLMAKHGIAVSTSQISSDSFMTKTGQKETLNFACGFKLWLTHSTTGQKGSKEGIIVPLPYTGAQTAGIARSYAIKEYLKGRFLQSSGDLAEDADNFALDVKLSREKARPYFEGICAELDTIAKKGNSDDLILWSEKHKVIIDAMPDDWKVHLRSEFHQAQIGVKLRTDADKAFEDLPDMTKWKEDFETELDLAESEDILHEVWASHEHTIDALIATDRAEIERLFSDRLDALK